MSALIQYCVPQHLLSRLVGLLAKSKCSVIKNLFIGWFVKRYQVNMNEAAETDPHQYCSFNAFFIRALKPGIRPVVEGEQQIACPVDGVISQIGTIKAGRVFQAKGFEFTVDELLGGNINQAAWFANGKYATLYLAPRDYHRIHMPIDGLLTEMVYVPGHLFSVNTATTASVPRLFARNERVVAFFDTAMGPMAVVLVGAMIVASINTVWHGVVTAPQIKTVTRWDYQNQAIRLQKGDELGYFSLGSTVIVLFGNNAVEWNQRLQEQTAVKLGELLGEKQ